jgi:hypothetical protein
MQEINKGRFFSVELKSKVNLKNVTVRDSSQEVYDATHGITDVFRLRKCKKC